MPPTIHHGIEAMSREDVVADVEAILASFDLQGIRRFIDQVHWEAESDAAHRADRQEPGLKLENVAAHSWHVADMALLLADHFPELDAERSVALGVLHDKLEKLTGDYDPIGSDGQGTATHAFDASAKAEKIEAEWRALATYLASLRPSLRARQQALLAEVIDGTSPEARFVMALDKIQALAFVLEKKGGAISDPHLAFTVRYSSKANAYFPGLALHHGELMSRLFDRVADYRRISRSEVDELAATFGGERDLVPSP